jgi:hypothetical protein
MNGLDFDALVCAVIVLAALFAIAHGIYTRRRKEER